MKIYSYRTMLNESGNPYLVKDHHYEIDGRRVYNTPGLIAEFVQYGLGIQYCAEEYVYMLCFDNKNHLIGCFEIGHGTVSASTVSPREIFQKALMIGAVNIAITHNHPGNDPTPSQADLEITKRIQEAGIALDIQLLDHIIVSQIGYFSMRLEGGIL